MKFKKSLLINSMYAIFISIGISIFIGFFISKKMSKSLRDTAKIAGDIQLGEVSLVKETSIKEISAIRESLEELDTRLKLKQKSRQVLVDQLIHQTRTPLTILKSHLEAIEDNLVEVNDEEIKTFKNQIENITMIISNIGGLIDANNETDTLRVETFDINQMLKQIITGLKAQFTKKKISLELVTREKLALHTDKDKLSQSIYNILTNAYKYTNGDGDVKVSFIQLDDKVIIKIQDTGIGIEASETDKIFNAYYRSKQVIHTEGDGIGLYIVKDNIEKIGGNLSVISKLKVGSTFTIEIPVNYSKV
jgi:signal transduction histidine kinase